MQNNTVLEGLKALLRAAEANLERHKNDPRAARATQVLVDSLKATIAKGASK